MTQTIALIDDDRNLLTGISIALEREGYKIQTYIDGESALIGLTRNPPDLAVVDIKMPRMDGEELLKKLRKKMSIPIIFLKLMLFFFGSLTNIPSISTSVPCFNCRKLIIDSFKFFSYTFYMTIYGSVLYFSVFLVCNIH